MGVGRSVAAALGFCVGRQYENPLFNSLMTFIEPFPIELCHRADFRGGPEEKRRNRNQYHPLAGILI